MFDGKPTKIGRVLPITQPIERTAVATISTGEEERSLENWSYDASA